MDPEQKNNEQKSESKTYITYITIIVLLILVFCVKPQKTSYFGTGPEIFEADYTNIFGLHDRMHLEPMYKKIDLPSIH